MKAPDFKGEFQPLGPSKRQVEEAKTKDKPADVVKNVKDGVRTRNGKFETHIPGNEAAKMDFVARSKKLPEISVSNYEASLVDVNRAATAAFFSNRMVP